MLNYDVLSDFDFEILSKDVLTRVLGRDLFCFAAGPDQGIDLADKIINPSIIVQVKHYSKSTYSHLKSSLKKEMKKIAEIKPETYYIVTSKSLTRQKIEEIYLDFQEYMPSPKCIFTKETLDAFLLDRNNSDILRKHFKLWLTADLVLSEMLNKDIFMDCESLLDEIEEELPYFVETEVFFKAMSILQEHKKILLYGDPGVGKTITSKMLLLNFIKQGYAVRYTTNGSIANLKRSLSSDEEKPEIVFLDDFLGQHYMNLQANQENELVSLIRYIDRNPNKMLILNSRVTVFNQAIQNFSNLEKYFIFKDFKMYRIDLSVISDIEKARIFLAKLKQFRVPNEYYNDVRKNNGYRTIINHKNYNPRLIEFVCTPKRYSPVLKARFYDFIVINLQNPHAVWKNEFDNRLEYIDRIFMYVLYSITDYKVDIDKLKSAFNFCIKDSVEETLNYFDSILERLNESLLKIDVHLGKRRVGVINPSVNDFLRASIVSNINLKNKLLDYAIFYDQLERLMTKGNFEAKLESIIWDEGNRDSYSGLVDKLSLDLYIHLIAKYKVDNENHLHLVVELLFDGLRDVQIGKLYFSAIKTITIFLEDDVLWNHYDLNNYHFDEDTINRVFSECSDIEDAVTLTNLLIKRLKETSKDSSELKSIIQGELRYRIKWYIEDYDFKELITSYNLEEVLEYERELYTEFKQQVNTELLKIKYEDIKRNYDVKSFLSEKDFTEIFNEIVNKLTNKNEHCEEAIKKLDYSIDDILDRPI